jgi:hypothetical protein
MCILLLAATLLSGAPAGAEPSALPAGVPNIFDPEVQAKFQPVALVALQGNPDLPVIVLENTAGEQPHFMMLGLDARNGKDTWSLGSDPVILIILLDDPNTIVDARVDTGFSRGGSASGVFATFENPERLTLPFLLKRIGEVPARTHM